MKAAAEEEVENNKPTEEAFQRLPIIDISPFVRKKGKESGDGGPTKAEVARQLRQACEEVGFFYVVGHGVPAALQEEARALAKRFFDLPQSEKDAISVTQSPGFRGYQKLGENVTLQKKDWHEAIDLHRDDLNPQSPSMHEVEALLGDWIYSPNQWPSLPSDFKPFFQQYIREMLRLGEDMMRAIAMSLELPSEDFFVEKNLTNESYWVMRVIGYPTLDRSVPDLGLSCGEHCDYGCLTIVNQDDTKGALQVKNTAGQWINADPIPGAFVVNLGDMLHVWSNGRYQSTPHRVVNAGTNYRISIPFFYEPNIDCVVEPLLSSSSSSSSSSSNTADKSFKKKVHYGAHLKSKIFNNFKFDE
ncbi:2-oxoglutarate-Fe(II) type oxidoreductase-like isoform X1 [Balamuthia mandrillaris]